MRIGMLADAYKPHVSGITHYISLSKKYLEKAGHEVFVFTFGGENYQDDEPNIVRSPGFPLIDTGYYINFRYPASVQRLLYTMDVVHVHHPFISGRLALRYCRPKGIPIVFTNHTRYDLYAQAYLPILPEEISETFLKAYLGPFCAACDLVIAPSHGILNVLRHLGVETPVEVIPNGVELAPFRQVLQPVKRNELGFSEENVLLIYAGRLGPEKNLPFLLRAFAATVKAYESARLLIIGDGPERDNLEDRVQYMGIREKVRFVGMVPYAEIPRYLAIGDAFVTASVTEVHPLSVIEAMAAGLPVLGIHSPGVGDIVEEDVTGFLAPEEDLAVFTAKMVRLVAEPETRKMMSKNARHSATKYDIEQITQILLAHYERLQGSPRQRLSVAPGRTRK